MPKERFSSVMRAGAALAFVWRSPPAHRAASSIRPNSSPRMSSIARRGSPAIASRSSRRACPGRRAEFRRIWCGAISHRRRLRHSPTTDRKQPPRRQPLRRSRRNQGRKWRRFRHSRRMIRPGINRAPRRRPPVAGRRRRRPGRRRNPRRRPTRRLGPPVVNPRRRRPHKRTGRLRRRRGNKRATLDSIHAVASGIKSACRRPSAASRMLAEDFHVVHDRHCRPAQCR